MVNHIKNADVHRAGDGTMAASYAEVHAEPLFIINEFMHRTLSPATVFHRTGVMSASHQGEVPVVTGIIAFIANPVVPDLLVGDLETVAGRTDKSTGVAADAILRNLFKCNRIKLLLQFLIDFRVIHFQTE